MKKIIVIGCSTVGMTAASKIKRELKDQVEIIGYQKLSYPSLGACGLPYYIGGNFEDSNLLIARTVAQFSEQGIIVKTNHEVTAINCHHKTLTVKNLHTGEIFEDNYDHLIIATGAHPLKPDIPGIDGRQVFTLNNIEDANNIKAVLKKITNIVVVGAGHIGLELCDNISKLHKKITLIEKETSINAQSYDLDVSNAIVRELVSHNIKVKLGMKVNQILLDENTNVIGVKLTNDEVISCQMIIFAIGVIPNTTFLTNTEIKLNNQGAIQIDKTCQTSVKDVYAGGDCVTTYSHLTNQVMYCPWATVASKMGKVIANNILTNYTEFGGSLKTSILQLYNLQIARTGMTESEAQSQNINYQIIVLHDSDHTHYIANVKSLLIKVIYDKDHDVIVGGQLIGYNNSILRIYALIPLIWNQIKIKDNRDLDLPYAPQFAKVNDLLNLIFSKLTEK